MKLRLSTINDPKIDAPAILNEDGEMVAVCFGYGCRGPLLAQDIVERYNAYENRTNTYPTDEELDKMAERSKENGK